MPLADDDITPQSNPPPPAPDDDDLYAPFRGANGMGTPISGAPLDVGPTWWSDIPHALAAGGHQVAAETAGVVAATAQSPQTIQAANDFAAAQDQAARESEQAMSPAAQRPGFFSHPGVSTAEALPGIGAIAAPAAVGSIIAGPIGAGVVTSALMGAQQLGSAQNRAAGQDIQLTPGQKLEQFGIGAAAGAVPELGLPGKIVAGPLARKALGVAEGATTFGVSGAGSEAASEQTEIAAGKRQGYDPNAIGSAFATGAEQGAGVSALGGARGGHREQTGGASTVSRSSRDGFKEGVSGNAGKPPAPPPRDDVAAGPARPASPVDPTQQAALDADKLTPKSDVTPESKVQSSPVQSQAPVVQPTPSPVSRASEAPPAPDTTGQLPPPQPPSTLQPTPAPVNPVPEPDAALQQQHAALLDPNNPREAMVYPPGAQPIDITSNKGRFGTTKLADGRAVQFDRNGPSKLTAAKIKQADKGDRLNELLQLGPISQTDAVNRASAGEPVAVVTERTPEGTEAKAAAGTTATAPAQVDALEATKTPGNTIQVEAPADVIADREGAVASPPEVTPVSKSLDPLAGATKLFETKAGVKVYQDAAGQHWRQKGDEAPTPLSADAVKLFSNLPKAEDRGAEKVDVGATRMSPEEQALVERQRQGRILRSETPEDQAAEARQAEAERARVERLAAERPAVKPVKEKEDIKPKNISADERDRLIGLNAVADDVARSHPPKDDEALALDPTKGSGGVGARARLSERAKAMVQEAKDKGFKFMRPLRRRTGETDHSNGAVLLHEAELLARKKVPTTSDYHRFMNAEHELLRNGEQGKEAVYKMRSDTGRDWAAAGAAPVKEVATEGVGEREAAEHPDLAEEYDAAKQREADKTAAEVAAKEEGKRELTENEKRAQIASERARAKLAEQEAGVKPSGPTEGKEGESYMAGKPAVAAFTVQKARPKVQIPKAPKKQEAGPASLPAYGITSERTSTLANSLADTFNPKRYSAPAPMMTQLHDAIVRLAGDMPTHYISEADMTKAAGSPSHGLFNYDGYILLNKDNLRHDTALHEGFHAATTIAIDKDPQLGALLDRFHAELKAAPIDLDSMTAGERSDLRYALSDPQELLTMMMTDPHVQDVLKGVKISPELARDIQIPKWRKATMWEGALSLIRRALGLGPRETPAIEAAMALTEKAMWQHEGGGAGMAMEAAGRLANKQFRLQRIFEPEAERQDEQRMPSRISDIGSSVARAAYDARDTLSAAAAQHLPKWMNGVELTRTYGKMFTDEHGNIIDGLMSLSRRKTAEMARLATEDAPMIREARMLGAKYAGHQDTMSQLEHDATKFNVRAEEAPTSVKGKPHARAMDDWQRNAHQIAVHEQFNALPKELQDHHIAKREFYADKLKDAANQHIDMVLDNFPLPAGETRASVERMIRDNDLSDDVKEHYDNLDMLAGIEHDQRMLGTKATYFAGGREGNHVVVGKYHMPDGGSATDYSGSNLPENVREFGTREEAHDYVAGTQMKADTKIKYFFDDPNKPGHFVSEITDPATGKIVKASPAEYDERRYQVTLMHEHMEAHPSYVAAKRARQNMIDNGLHSVSDVLDKRKEGNWGRINTDAGQAMERRISDRTDLTPAQKQAAIEAARAYQLVSRGGYQSHMMQRRNVAGAQYSSADTLQSYANAVNRHVVNKQFARQTDIVMKRLEDKDDENRTTGVGYMSSAVANELRDRVYRNPEEMAAKNAPWVNRLMLTAYMRWLVGPRHLLMLQTHPYAYSAPQMAGRHGPKIYSLLHQAAKDMGGDFSGARAGIKATYDQARSLFARDPERAAGLATTPDVTKDMIGRLKNDDERSAMNTLANSGELHSGFGDEFYGASGLQRVDALVRQLSSAQDAQNRAVVGLTAYRAEFAKTGSREKAIDYARTVIQDTMGVHSSMDVASVLKNPLARVFMQFKQFPMRQIELMARNVYNGFKGETPEVKREAWRAFAHQAASGFTMAGVHGLPIGLLKPLGLLGMALGITPTPSQIDDRFRRGLADMIGATGANTLMDGVGAAVPHAPDVSNMFSYNLDTMFGEPRGDEWWPYIADQAGAGVSTLKDTAAGALALTHGDIGGAISKLPLPRMIPDAAKAYGLAQRGQTTTDGSELTPASYEDAAWRLLGFGTQQQQRISAGREAAQADLKEQTKGNQLKAKHEAKRGAKETIMGLPVTPKSKSLLREREEVYQ
jgi:hypothetical protein